MPIASRLINLFKDIKNLCTWLKSRSSCLLETHFLPLFKNHISNIILLIFWILIHNSIPAIGLSTHKIYSFNKNKPSKLEIVPDYEKKIFTCHLEKNKDSISLYEKKWVLSKEHYKSEKNNNQKEIYNTNLEFSLAKDFNFITCEAIAFDGLLFKKITITKNYTDFQNWPILSPAIESYTNENLTRFSLENFVKKSVSETYSCVGISQTPASKLSEERFCSFIDSKTGAFSILENKIDFSHYILQSKSSKILNLKAIIIKNNIPKLEIPFQVYLTSKNSGEVDYQSHATKFGKISLVSIKEKEPHIFSCMIPDEFKKNPLNHVFWYSDKELISSLYNNYEIFIHDVEQNKILSCLILAHKGSTLFYGAATYKLSNAEPPKPQWIKNTFLVDISNLSYREPLQYKALNHYSKINCQVITSDNKIIMEEVCERNGKNFYLSIKKSDTYNLKKFFSQNPPLDESLLPNFTLIININNYQYKTNIYFYRKTYKPILYTSALLKNGFENTCIFVVKDTQNLYLTGQFFIYNIKNPSNIVSVFSKHADRILSSLPIKLQSELQKKRINIISYNFKNHHSFCKLILSNGTTIAGSLSTEFMTSQQFQKNLASILKNTDITPEKKFNLKKEHFNNIVFNSFKSPNLIPINIDNNHIYFSLIKDKTINFPYIEQIQKDNIRFLIPLIDNQKIEKKDDLNLFFSTEAYINQKEHKFICKIKDPTTNESIVYHYSIFSNGKLIFSKSSKENILRFKIKKISLNNIFTCQTTTNNKIDSSSFSFDDKTNFQRFCYGLSNNSSIFVFNCPHENLTYDDKYNKDSIRKTLIEQFQDLKNIKWAKIIIWSESQKNKRSLTFDLL